jgi:hypothetical protein
VDQTMKQSEGLPESSLDPQTAHELTALRDEVEKAPTAQKPSPAIGLH